MLFCLTVFVFYSIPQFDTYLRSLSIDPHSPNFHIITDGQLPLRQCLHPEACAKDITLPSYYWKFSDIRKEYVKSKSGDLSRALIPMIDAKKLPNMPGLPLPPASIGDIMTGELCFSIFRRLEVSLVKTLKSIDVALID